MERERTYYATTKESNAYIKRLLTKNTTLRRADIPDWLVEAKRAQLLLKREANK